MKFADHSKLEGFHAPFSPSKSSWLRYDDEKLLEIYQNMRAAEMGTRLHKWAQDTIDLGIKQPRSKKTIYAYVNDAIGFKMDTEVILFYSKYFFAKSFNELSISIAKSFSHISVVTNHNTTIIRVSTNIPTW